MSGCGTLRVDDLVAEGMRNEVSAIRTARGRRVEVAGPILEVKLPQAHDQQMKRGRRDNPHSPSVEIVSEGGTRVTCYLAGDQVIQTFVAGRNDRLEGKFYDFLQDENGKFTVVMVNCHTPQ